MTSPSGPLNQRFTLAPGRMQTVDSRTSIRFLRVTGDSRCPADAVCILGGDAIVEAEVLEGGRSRQLLELHTGDSRRAFATYANMRIELVELQPFPFSSRLTAPEDYRATFAVTRP